MVSLAPAKERRGARGQSVDASPFHERQLQSPPPRSQESLAMATAAAAAAEAATTHSSEVRWLCVACTFANHGGLTNCEICFNPRAALAKAADASMENKPRDESSPSEEAKPKVEEKITPKEGPPETPPPESSSSSSADAPRPKLVMNPCYYNAARWHEEQKGGETSPPATADADAGDVSRASDDTPLSQEGVERRLTTHHPVDWNEEEADDPFGLLAGGRAITYF